MHIQSPLHKKSSFGHRVARFFHRLGRDPFLDWQFIVILSFAGILLLSSVAYDQYIRVQKNLSAPSSSQKYTAKSVFDADAFAKVLSIYNTRAIETQQLQEGYTGAHDPSD